MEELSRQLFVEYVDMHSLKVGQLYMYMYVCILLLLYIYKPA